LILPILSLSQEFGLTWSKEGMRDGNGKAEGGIPKGWGRSGRQAGFGSGSTLDRYVVAVWRARRRTRAM
jgi:hypothetical protein